MKRILCCWGLAAAVCAAASEVPPIILKSREYQGGEAALAKVNSVHFLGTIETQLRGDPGSKRLGKLDIVFQKPWQESITSVEPDALVRRVLDDYNGWQLEQKRSPQDPVQFDPNKPESLTILGPDQVRSLRADTWENLYYYRDIEEVGGTIQDIGPATMDGVSCEQVKIVHADSISYDRYFDVSTGRLVFTATSAGAQIREFGSQLVDGVRFPQKITIDEKANGKAQTTTVELTQVTVNEIVPESFFVTPPPPLPLDQPQPTKTP